MHNFEKIIERTSEKHRVIALDLPGFGGSISFVEEYSIERYADMIRDFIKASRFKEFHLICHSMGGQVCISLSLKDPSALKSITLIDTAGTYERSDFVEKIAKRLGKINIGVTSVEGGVSLADLTWYDQSFMKRFISPEPLFIMAMESYRTNFRDRIKELSIPPLIIWGMDDPIFPVPIAFHLKENIKGAILYLVKDAGHSPQVSHPDLVYHWIEKYHLERSKTSPL